MRAYDVLGKLKWEGGLDRCMIIIRHRGAKNDRKTVSGKDVTEIKKSYFMYKDGKETFIPMHRILEIRADGKPLWKRSQHKKV
jgi:uncharacterized protein (UPF0248 family)